MAEEETEEINDDDIDSIASDSGSISASTHADDDDMILLEDELDDDLEQVSTFNAQNSKVKIDREVIVSIDETYNQYYTIHKKTRPFITKFEKAKILGVRAEMISSGSIPLVKIPSDCTSSMEIANLEYKEKKIPLLIRRKFPNGDTEDWRLEELIL